MQYIPIFSSEIEEKLGKNVVLIGKVIDILNERKYIKLKCLDIKGYFEVILYEPLNIEKFASIIVLGKIKEFQNEKYVYARKIIKFEDIKDEIIWRKFFIKGIRRRSKISTKKKAEEKAEELENVNIEVNNIPIIEDIRKEILSFIREYDKGDGVSFEDIKKFFDLSDEKLKKYIEDLLAAGEIYEVSPNKYKVI